MKLFQKLFALTCTAALSLGCLTACAGTGADSSAAPNPTASSPAASSGSGDIISLDTVAETLGAGWNYGNTMEAINNGVVSETAWGNPAASQEVIDLVAASGFKTVRVPVSYIDKIDDANGYTVDAAWLDRVEEVVGYCYNAGMNVIINVHGDGYNSIPGGWLLCNGDNQDYICEKYEALWRQIAEKFKDYDEHLIFESMNEEFDGEYHDPVREYYENINTYNQIFVDTVRAAGGNNTHRWLLVPGWNTDINYTVGNYGFSLPEDPANTAGEGRLLLSVHYYNPWEYAGEENYRVYLWGDQGQALVDMGAASRGVMPRYGDQNELLRLFTSLKENYVDQGVPVVIGEYGCIDKTPGNETLAAEITRNRAYYDAYVAGTAASMGIIPVYWDNGFNGPKGFGLFDRNAVTVTQPTLIDAIITAVAEKKPADVVEPNVTVIPKETKPSEIHAYIGVQTKAYTFRNGVSDATYGKASGMFDTLIKWEDVDGDGTDDITDTGAKFSDAEITSDGTYTVSVSGYDFAADSEGLNMLFVSTDFPYNGKLRIKDFILTVDDTEYEVQPNIIADDMGNAYFELVNIYSSEAPNPEFDMPHDSISITFTLEGVQTVIAAA